MIDMTSACRRTSEVLSNVKDHQLDGPTPCTAMPLRSLVVHVGGLAQAFAAAARKDFGPLTDTPPADDAPLAPDWRTAYPDHLAELAKTWQDADAWTGMTRAGNVDLPGEVAGLVALAEVVIHGWDVARASGQRYDVDEPIAQACLQHLAAFDTSGTEGLFGPAVPVAGDAPAVDRIVALSGRDPGWRP
jgi:uncharacterized protein (TIGR03086 family)